MAIFVDAHEFLHSCSDAAMCALVHAVKPGTHPAICKLYTSKDTMSACESDYTTGPASAGPGRSCGECSSK